MTGLRSLRATLPVDVAFHYETAGRRIPAPWWLLLIIHPSIRAIALFRLCAGSRGLEHYVWRNLLITLHGCDVGSGVIFAGPVNVPHPTGIVIGKGGVIGRRVHLFHHVTVGRSLRDGYATVGDDVVLYAGCVLAGPISVGAGAVIGANQVVTRDVPARGVVRSATC